MLTFGPIFQLQLYGMLCPCLQKSEDVNAKQAVRAINSACKRVQWIRDSNTGSSSSSSMSTGGFLGGILAKVTSVTSASYNRSSKTCLAQIILQDSGTDGQPELFIDPIPDRTFDEEEEQQPSHSNQETPQQLQRQATGYKLNLKLRRVDKVTLDELTGQIILYAKPVIKDGKRSPAKELLRFVALSSGPSSESAITHDERNMLVHHFMVVSEWERQRRAALSSEEAYESDDDDDDGPNFLARRAQKATQYAKREMEMQQTKRDREKRKAKLIAESGGLKYTAMAMANRMT